MRYLQKIDFDGTISLDTEVIEWTSDGGPWATHSMPCPVCMDQHAVMNLGSAPIFSPCHKCTNEGWHTSKKKEFWQKVKCFLEGEKE